MRRGGVGKAGWERILVIIPNHVGADNLGGGIAEEEEQFLAFAADGHDVHLADGAELAQGGVDVEHGRGFDDYSAGAAAEEWQQGQDVGSAVLEGRHPSAVAVAARWVDDEGSECPVGLLAEPLDAVALMDADVLLAEDGEVVCGQLAEVGVLLAVVHEGDALGDEEGVDAHAAGEVGGGTEGGVDERGLVARRGLRRTLLAVEARGVDHVGAGREGGPLVGGCGEAFELLGHEGHLHLGVAVAVKEQAHRVVVTVRLRKTSYGKEVHTSGTSTTSKCLRHVASSGAPPPWGGPPCR